MRKALFLKTKHLGDSIVLTSAINAMPSDWTVDVLCFKDSEPIFRMCPRVSEVYTVPRDKTGFKKLLAYCQIFFLMKARNYDFIAQFTDDWRGAFLTRLLKPQLSVAQGSDKRPKWWHQSFSVIAKKVRSWRHAAELDVDLLRRAGLYQGAFAPKYNIQPQPHNNLNDGIEQWLQTEKISLDKLIIIHAAARWKFKGLPKHTWVPVINQLLNEGYSLVLSGAPSDQEFNHQIKDLIPDSDCLVIAPGFSLHQTAMLYSLAKLVVSIDSMSVHLASALGIPVVAIYGPSGEKNWGPWSVTCELVVQPESLFPCRPCGMDGCAGSKVSHCLETIQSDQIMNACKKLLI
jgi:heptosyltransferase-3